jgi:hypothetical protein
MTKPTFSEKRQLQKTIQAQTKALAETTGFKAKRQAQKLKLEAMERLGMAAQAAPKT